MLYLCIWVIYTPNSSKKFSNMSTSQFHVLLISVWIYIVAQLGAISLVCWDVDSAGLILGRSHAVS